MKPERIQILAAIYKRKKAEKKAEEKALRNAKKKMERRDASIARRAQKRKEKREILKKELHIKRLHKNWKKAYTKQRRKRINHRYYIRHIRRPFVRRRLHRGDEQGRFIIYFTKNKQYYKTYGWFIWKFGSLEKYNKLVAENHENSICPRLYESRTKKNGEEPIKYEIIVKQKIDPSNDTNETLFRDEIGSSVTVKTDNPEWKIIAKENWYIEEDFYLFGYHPKYDRKDTRFIMDNVIMKYVEENMICRIFIWKSYLFIENDDDFTFVLTKAPEEAIRLYNILYNRLSQIENLYFTGTLSKGSIPTWVDKMAEKTGWQVKTIKNCKPILV